MQSSGKILPMPHEIISSGRKIVLVEASTAQNALLSVESCESCIPDVSDILFDWILGDFTGAFNLDETPAHHIAPPLTCPKCGSGIAENTLVERKNLTGTTR